LIRSFILLIEKKNIAFYDCPSQEHLTLQNIFGRGDVDGFSCSYFPTFFLQIEPPPKSVRNRRGSHELKICDKNICTSWNAALLNTILDDLYYSLYYNMIMKK